jgi:hypothetical protein
VVLQAIAEGWRGDAQALAFLRDRAATDPEPSTRVVVLQAIAEGWRGDAQALAFLWDRAATDPEPSTRAAAFEVAYTVFRSLRPWEQSDISNEMAAFIRDRFHDPDVANRQSAINVASRLLKERRFSTWSEFETSFGPLMFNLLRDRATNDPEVRLRVVALEKISDSFSGPFLSDVPAYKKDVFPRECLAFLRKQAAHSADATIRSIALSAIGTGWRGDAQALAFLQDRAIADRDAAVRSTGLRTIGWNWGTKPQALEFLQERARDDPEAVTRAAASDILDIFPKRRHYSATGEILETAYG